MLAVTDAWDEEERMGDIWGPEVRLVPTSHYPILTHHCSPSATPTPHSQTPTPKTSPSPSHHLLVPPPPHLESQTAPSLLRVSTDLRPAPTPTLMQSRWACLPRLVVRPPRFRLHSRFLLRNNNSSSNSSRPTQMLRRLRSRRCRCRQGCRRVRYRRRIRLRPRLRGPVRRVHPRSLRRLSPVVDRRRRRRDERRRGRRQRNKGRGRDSSRSAVRLTRSTTTIRASKSSNSSNGRKDWGKPQRNVELNDHSRNRASRMRRTVRDLHHTRLWIR